MYAEIHSKQGSLWGEQPGDRRQIQSSSMQMERGLVDGEEVLVVTATQTRGTSSRRGPEKWTEATLAIQLRRQELQSLVERSVMEGLVDLPGREKVADAIRLLQEILNKP